MSDSIAAQVQLCEGKTPVAFEFDEGLGVVA
ncbi:MAG: hypothetical protein ACI9GW_002683 [Halieaceae bacterium]|jgi:hypothetical protein